MGYRAGRRARKLGTYATIGGTVAKERTCHFAARPMTTPKQNTLIPAKESPRGSRLRTIHNRLVEDRFRGNIDELAGWLLGSDAAPYVRSRIAPHTRARELVERGVVVVEP